MFEADPAYLSTLTNSKLQGGPDCKAGRRGDSTAPSCRARGGAAVLGGSLGCHGLRRCWTRGLAPPGRDAATPACWHPARLAEQPPPLHRTLLPSKAEGPRVRARPTPGGRLRLAIKASRTPPMASGSRALPTGWVDSSLWLNLRFNRALVLHMRSGSLGHHKPVWRSLRGRVWGPFTEVSPGHVLGPLTQEGSKTRLPEGTARPSLGSHEGRDTGGCFRGPRRSGMA